MANSLAHKRLQKIKVAELTVDELTTLLSALIDRKLAEWARDPRVARRRAEIAANATATRTEYRAGRVRRGTVRDLVTAYNFIDQFDFAFSLINVILMPQPNLRL